MVRSNFCLLAASFWDSARGVAQAELAIRDGYTGDQIIFVGVGWAWFAPLMVKGEFCH